MKSIRLFLMSVLIGGLSVVSTPGFADDTELYRGQIVTISDEDRPNILFVIDRTGSMDFLDYDENGDSDGLTRQDRFEEAMLQLLDEVHNVNVGLMTFSDRDGSSVALEFPVTFVDEPARSVTGELDDSPVATSQISSSSDDAEENTDTGAVNITDEVLEATFIEGTEIATGITVESRILENSDDAREFLGNGDQPAGKVFATSNDWMAIGGSSWGQVIVGLRFQGVNVPKDAEILSAQIVFTAGDDDSGPLSDIVIYGVDKNNAAAFNENNYRISGGTRFQKTSASTNWNNIPAWLDENEYETPSLVDIVQEIVNRGGWSSGNRMAFRIERTGNFNNYPSDEHRRFYTRGESTSKAPLLRITYAADAASGGVAVTSGGGGADPEVFEQRITNSNNDAFEYRGGGTGSLNDYNLPAGVTILNYQPRLGDGYCQNSSRCRGEQLTGLRFEDLDIPKGAVISEATVEFTAEATGNTQEGDPLDIRIYAEDSVNAPAFQGHNWNSRTSQFSNPNENISSRTRLPGSVSWNNVASVSSPNKFSSANFSSLLQTLVEKDAWQKNDNAVVFLFERTSPNKELAMRITQGSCEGPFVEHIKPRLG
ncbi:MAG: VWA domain-containing protein, partial [Pseudomonadota bacterium]